MPSHRDRVELPGSMRNAVPGATDTGPADPNQEIEVTVLLRRGSSAAAFPRVEETAANLPRDRKYLSREEFARLHGASAADIEKIREFAKFFGLKISGEDPAARTLKLKGTVKEFNEAFGVQLRRYKHAT